MPKQTETVKLSDASLAALVRAMVTKTHVLLGYTPENGDGITQVRTAFPFAMKKTRKGHTIVKAWCPHRQDYRTFRLDRISLVSPSNLYLTDGRGRRS